MMPPGGVFDPHLMELFQELTGALIQFTPEHFQVIHCTIRPAGSAALSYEIACPAFPDEGTTKVNTRVAAGAEALQAYWTREGALFPGLRIELTKQADGQWRNRVQNLEFEEQQGPPASEEALAALEPPTAQPWWQRLWSRLFVR